jgi:hypothetical protein
VQIQQQEQSKLDRAEFEKYLTEQRDREQHNTQLDRQKHQEKKSAFIHGLEAQMQMKTHQVEVAKAQKAQDKVLIDDALNQWKQEQHDQKVRMCDNDKQTTNQPPTTNHRPTIQPPTINPINHQPSTTNSPSSSFQIQRKLETQRLNEERQQFYQEQQRIKDEEKKRQLEEEKKAMDLYMSMMEMKVNICDCILISFNSIQFNQSIHSINSINSFNQFTHSLIW